MSDRLYLPPGSKGATVYWLLEIHWAGQTIRLSTTELDIYDSGDGIWRHYHSALNDIRLEEGLGELASQSEHQTLPIEAVLPVNVPELIAQGHDLSAGRATLYRWIKGQNHSQRRTVIHGKIRDPEWGEVDEAVNFSIEENVWQDQALIPSATQRVDGLTWPQEILDLAIDHLGKPYPLVFGHPGQVDTAINAAGWITGTEARWAIHDPVDHPSGSGVNQYDGMVLVIAGHHVSAERVYINTAENIAGDRVRVYNGFDALGNPVAFVPWYYSRSGTSEVYNYDAGGTYTWVNPSDFDGNATYSIGHETISNPYLNSNQPQVWVGWRDDEDSARGGAMINGRLVREAGDLVQWLLAFSTIPVDQGRFASARRLLSHFKCDGIVNERVSPWNYLKDLVLPLLPVSLRNGPQGTYPIVWRYDATHRDAVAHINADADVRIERAARLRMDSDNIFNDFELKYAYSRRTDTYAGRVRLGNYAQATQEGADTLLPSLICKRSQERFRLPDGRLFVSSRTWETRMIYDRATAIAICEWWAAHFALPWVTVPYILPEAEFMHLEPGSVVMVTDSKLAMYQRIALVQKVQTDSSGALCAYLRLMENPSRDG